MLIHLANKIKAILYGGIAYMYTNVRTNIILIWNTFLPYEKHFMPPIFEKINKLSMLL